MSHRQTIQFDDPSSFREEYERNIANGGAFFPSDDSLELREIIEVELELRFCGERIALEAEVVHAGGGNVAVQFLLPASELRARLEPVLESSGAAPHPAREPAPPLDDPSPSPAVAAPEPIEVPQLGTPEESSVDSSEFDPEDFDSEYLDVDEGSGAPSADTGGLDLELGSDTGGLDLELGSEPTVIDLDADPPRVERDDELDRSALSMDAGDEGGPLGRDDDTNDFEIGTDFDPDEISSDDLASALEEDEGLTPATDPTLAPLSGDEGSTGNVPEVMAELTDPALKIAMDPPAPSATEAQADPLARVEDRREAPRSQARVPARLVTTNLDLSGRTRDLSESGVLVSADGNELPVGRKVRLELQHPESGEPIEVRGRVSRHVEGEGTVAAVGISFEDTGDAGLAAFVEDVRANEERQVESGITGVIQELGMANLIQMLGQSSPLGTLTATHDREEGVVAFEHGQLRYAQLGSLSGVKALARMLSWEEGAFEFRAHVDAITDEDEPQHLEMAILEAVRQLDEAKLADAPRFRGDQTFRIDREALGAQSGLPKAEEAVLDLATAGFTVRRILDVIPESDAQVFDALTSLAEAGILLPADDADADG